LGNGRGAGARALAKRGEEGSAEQLFVVVNGNQLSLMCGSSIDSCGSAVAVEQCKREGEGEEGRYKGEEGREGRCKSRVKEVVQGNGQCGSQSATQLAHLLQPGM